MVANEEIEVVISGIGGFLPKSENIEEFQNLLFNQENVAAPARWESANADHPDLIGNLSQMNSFDASYFGIHRLQTVFLDPLCRLALENTFEALVDAGINPTSVRGKRIAVIVGSTLSENDSLMFENVENGFGVTGQARAMLANRVSYWMHATGPSYSVDNSWVGGLQALQNGYEAVKSGQCDGAIVGALNLAMNIFPHYLFKAVGLPAPDQHTRVFDEKANGYLRSEGIVMMYLQNAKTARRSYASVVDVEVIYNGARTGSFCKMNVDFGRKFLTNFYKRANVDPSSVQYVETYGSAIKPLDEFEIDVIDSVFKPTKDKPLLIGSVKSTIGHTEAAATFASIVKTIIAMEKREIPPNSALEQINSNIPALHDGRIKVVTEQTPWPGNLAAINGYGLVTTYGHLLLRSNTESMDKKKKKDGVVSTLPHLITISTRNEEGIREIVNKVKSQPTLNYEYTELINDVFYNNISGHLYRGYVVSSESTQKDEPITHIDEITHFSGIQRPVWFVYSGMGSQWISMGKDLLRLPVFAAAIAKCHATLEPHGINLTEIITSDKNADMFDNILHCFVGIAAIQIGLTDILHELGIKPDNMLGHSVGELGCAYADGCLTAEQMILSAYYRGRASIEVELEPGLMAAIGMGASKMKELLPPKVDIACRNGPDSCTISGPAEVMRQLVGSLQGSGVFARLVDVAGIAYHSRYIRPAAPLLLNYLKQLIPNPKLRSASWLSTSVPEANGGWSTKLAQHASAEYLTNNLLSCVNLEDTLTHVPNEAVIIEIAPHGLLQAILKRSLDNSCVNIALTRRGEEDGIKLLLSNIGKLYLAGIPVRISNLYKEDVNATYTAKCCSRGTPSLAPLVRWNHTEQWRTGIDEFKDNSNSECTYMLDINSEMFHDLNGHRIYRIGDDAVGEGTITVPISTYLPLVCSILSNIRRLTHIIFEDVHLVRHRIISEAINVYIPPFRIMTQRGTGFFEVSDRYGLIASGHYSLPQDQDFTVYADELLKPNIGKKINEITKEELYREFAHRGHNFQDNFKTINKLEMFEGGMTANIEWKTGWHMFIAAMLQMNIYREGKSAYRPIDTAFLRSLSYSFNNKNIPKEGANLNVVYNYATDNIISPVVTICGSRCYPYKIKSNTLIADYCYPVQSETVLQGKINNEQIAVVYTKVDAIHIEDLNMEVPWVMELKQLLNQNRYERIYLVIRVLPWSGIDPFLTYLQTWPDGHIISLIIVLDANAPEFKSINDAFYQPAFKQQNSSVSLYSSGVWEFRYTKSAKLKDPDYIKNDFGSYISEQHLRRHLPDVNVHFVGINTVSVVPKWFSTTELWRQKQLRVVDYCGIDYKSNHPVMGMATINNKNNLSADPILRWPLPKRWSLIDGATVPFAYTLAYYVLKEMVSAKSGESILIHNGCSNIGQAMIRVANSLGCIIYTTVASEKQKLVLLHHLRMLRSTSIFEYTSSHFEIDLMLSTQEAGIDILVNCLPAESLRVGLRCVASMGRVVHFIDEYQKEDHYTEKMGLGAFLRITGMYGIRPSKILQLPDDVKLRLRDDVSNAMKTEQIIIPIRRQIFRENGKQELHNIASYLMGPNVTGGVVISIEELVDKNQIKNNNNNTNKDDSTYIIYGDEEIENIITLTHWLATIYSAKHILILSSFSRNINDKKYFERSLSSIKTDNLGVSIQISDVPINKHDIVIQQITQRKIANIAGVLIFSNGNTQQDESFVKKLQSKYSAAHVVILSCITNVNLVNFERYYSKPLKNVSYVRCEKKRRFLDVLKSLSTALEETTDIFIREDNFENNAIDTTFSFQDYCNVLSSSIPTLLKWSPPGSSISLKQIISNSPKIMTESPPVFIIPGLFGSDCNYLQSTVKHLLSTVFILDADYSKLSFEQLSIQLGEQITKIFPSGPYNLIGVSSGGALAIELAKHLEIDIGAKVQLYLLDGIPDTMKSLVLEENKTKNGYEIVLLKHLFNIKDPKILAALTNAPPNWKARTEAILRYSLEKQNEIRHLLLVFKQRLDAVLTYTPDNRTFNGVTRLLKPIEATRESLKLTNLCKHIKTEVIKGNHFSMLLSPKLADYINNHIIVAQLYD